MTSYILSILVGVPVLGAALCLLFPNSDRSGVRGFALAISLVNLGLTCVALSMFDSSLATMQLTESYAWIDSIGVSYSVGVDGVSMLLVLLTSYLLPVVILSTYSSVTKRAREYMVCLLLLQAGMIGAFVATDLFLFYVFWEVMLIPMYFLIGIWGGERRIYATLKFFLYTMAGSLLMLVAIIYTVWAVRDPSTGQMSFAFADVLAQLHKQPIEGGTLCFLAFALAFAIKVPMFPFHTWLPDAHVQAPTGGSVVLAGVLLKLGTYGFFRYGFCLFPEASILFLPIIGILSVIGILYGAWLAMAQTDIKRLVAYSSVSHLGFVMLGLSAMTVTSVTGAVLQMVNHGISTAGLFLLVGVVYERRHTRELSDFGGLAKVMPRYALVFVILMLSSIGLPGLNGFVGEFLILMGTFQSSGTLTTIAPVTLAAIGRWAVYGFAILAVGLVAAAMASPNVKLVTAPWTRGLGVGAVALLMLVLAAPPALGGGGALIKPLQNVSGSGDFAHVFQVLAVLAATGVIFAAVYLLLATQKLLFGPVKHNANKKLADISIRETLVFGPLLAAAIAMGVYPQPWIEMVEPTVSAYTQEFRRQTGMDDEIPASVKPKTLRDIPGARDFIRRVQPQLMKQLQKENKQ